MEMGNLSQPILITEKLLLLFVVNEKKRGQQLVPLLVHQMPLSPSQITTHTHTHTNTHQIPLCLY